MGAALCAKAIENNVLIIPGNVFSSQDTHFRISYATGDEKLSQEWKYSSRWPSNSIELKRLSIDDCSPTRDP